MTQDFETGDRRVEHLLRAAGNLTRMARRASWPSRLHDNIDRFAEDADRACRRPASDDERELLDAVASLYLYRFVRSNDSQDLTRTVERYIDLYGPCASRPAEVLAKTADVLVPDPEQASAQHIVAAMMLFEAAASFGEPSSEQRLLNLRNAAAGWLQQYVRTGTLDHLMDQLRVLEQLVQEQTGDLAINSNAMLGWCLAHIREHTGDPDRGRAALAAWERAFAMQPATSMRTEIVGDAFEEAVALWSSTQASADRAAAVRWSLRMLDDGDRRADRVEPVAVAVYRDGSNASLRDSARLFRAIAEATAPGTAQQARNYLNAVVADNDLFERTHRPADLDRLIEDARTAVRRVPDDAKNHLELTGMLGQRLRLRHRMHSSADDLDEAVAVLENLLKLPAASSSPMLLQELGGAVQDRLTLDTSTPRRRELARICARAAGHIRSDDERRRWHVWAGQQFLDLARQRGRLSDLDAAIVEFDLACAGAGNWPGLPVVATGLAYALSQRYDLRGIEALPDLARAQHWLEQAAQAAPAGSPERWIAKQNLAVVVERLEEITPSLQMSHDLYDQLLDELPDDSDDFSDDLQAARRLMSLAQLLGRSHLRTHQQRDIDTAVALARQAGARTPSNEADEPVILTTLASLLIQRGLPEDGAAATATFQRAAERGLHTNAEWALRAARQWGTRADAVGDIPHAADAARIALRAATQLYDAQPAPSSQQFWLAATRDLANDCAHLLATAGSAVEAVVALEQGRAWVASAIMAVAGADLHQLRGTHAEVYAKFVTAADLWLRAVAADRASRPPIADDDTVSFKVSFDLISAY